MTDKQSDLLRLGVAELRAAYASKRLSPVDVVTAVLDAIEGDTRSINAFCLRDREGALQAARESERRHHSGSAIGPLDGVPVSIKDLANVRGWPTRRGSRATAGEPVAASDSPVA